MFEIASALIDIKSSLVDRGYCWLRAELLRIPLSAAMTDQAIACTMPCLETSDVAQAKQAATGKPFAMVSFVCRLSGQQEQVVLLSEAGATALAQSMGSLTDPASLRILCALASAELCECDIATLVERNQSDVFADLERLRAIGLLSVRDVEGMKYYALADTAMRYLLRDKIAALAA